MAGSERKNIQWNNTVFCPERSTLPGRSRYPSISDSRGAWHILDAGRCAAPISQPRILHVSWQRRIRNRGKRPRLLDQPGRRNRFRVLLRQKIPRPPRQRRNNLRANYSVSPTWMCSPTDEMVKTATLLARASSGQVKGRADSPARAEILRIPLRFFCFSVSSISQKTNHLQDTT